MAVHFAFPLMGEENGLAAISKSINNHVEEWKEIKAAK
jgi:hypothetical protein